jgi:hypothetical protein
MKELSLTEDQLDEYLSVALSNADRVGPKARHELHGLLRYYAKKPHPFTACVHDNRKRFGPRAEAVCAVLKDIIRGTTKWRGHNNPRDHGVSAAAMSEEHQDFVLDIPEDVQEFIDEIDSEYIGALMSQIDLAADLDWIEGKTSVNAVKRQIEMVLNSEGDQSYENKDGLDELKSGTEDYGMMYWVIDLDAEMDDAFVSCDGKYYDVPFSLDSDGDVKVSDRSKWTEVEQTWVKANLSQEPQMLAEMFFDGTDEEVRLENDGLIYKTLLREGEWEYSPGPGQVPINKPIRVVKDGASDGRSRTISINEIKSNFDAGIMEHVTVPKTHDDKVDENTGYVKALKIGADENGRATLEAGFDFTEPDIKEKVLRGTIANTSAGVLFDYVHKESGKKFNSVLAHAALTNHPWLNGMKPFGVEASEDLQVVAFSEGNKPTIKTGGEVMPEKTTEEKKDEVVAPEDTLATKLGLSEDEITSRLAEYNELKAKDKKHEVDAQITEWQDKGVTPAVLSEAKAILMADEGAVVLNLSEDGTAKPQTASQLVERLISAIPTVKLSDAPGTGEKEATGDKPANEEENPYADLSLSEKTEISHMVLYDRVPEEDAVKQVRAKREKK